MKERTQSRCHIALLSVVFGKEVAHPVLIGMPEFVVDELFGEHRLAATRIAETWSRSSATWSGRAIIDIEGGSALADKCQQLDLN